MFVRLPDVDELEGILLPPHLPTHVEDDVEPDQVRTRVTALWRRRRIQSMQDNEKVNSMVVNLANVITQCMFLYSQYQQGHGAVDAFSQIVDTTCVNQNELNTNRVQNLYILSIVGITWEIVIRIINFSVFYLYCYMIWKKGKVKAVERRRRNSQEYVPKSFHFLAFAFYRSPAVPGWALSAPQDYFSNPYSAWMWGSAAFGHCEMAMDMLKECFNASVDNYIIDPDQPEVDPFVEHPTYRIALAWGLLMAEDGVRLILKILYFVFTGSDNVAMMCGVSVVVSLLSLCMRILDILGIARDNGLWFWGCCKCCTRPGESGMGNRPLIQLKLIDHDNTETSREASISYTRACCRHCLPYAGENGENGDRRLNRCLAWRARLCRCCYRYRVEVG